MGIVPSSFKGKKRKDLISKLAIKIKIMARRYVYKMKKTKSAKGGEYWTIDTSVVLNIDAKTIKEVKDILDKRSTYKSTSKMRVPSGRYEFMFNGRSYTHIVK